MKTMKPVKRGSCGMFTAVVLRRSVPHLINAEDGSQSWAQTDLESSELIPGALLLVLNILLMMVISSLCISQRTANSSGMFANIVETLH